MAVYLDYNATAPLRPEARAAMEPLLGRALNPSSVHAAGREAKKHLESSRRLLAETVSAWPDEILFTGSGSESNATALRGLELPLLVSASEHHSVLHARRDAERLSVSGDGLLDLVALDEALRLTGPALVSVMLANNETGVIQPIAEIAALCHARGALLHCDAAQALGRLPVDFGALGADMLTLSSHKCGGPHGAAALVMRRGLTLKPFLTGGGQESGRRAGTQNVAAIAGFAAAAAEADPSEMFPLRKWLDDMESEAQSLGGVVAGKSALRLANTSCLILPGIKGEVQLIALDLAEIAVSAGAACTSGRIEPSHVLLAMGVPAGDAECAIRVSGGPDTAQADVHAFTQAWKKLAEQG